MSENLNNANLVQAVELAIDMLNFYINCLKMNKLYMKEQILMKPLFTFL